ncbi:PorP/SprF family type IX secretion system membrane protein [Chitinophaga filiformis]|uniref:Type IX secretion system membrane protein, PorP/SprF family n=1 Tax=Chitinophaga filiformis TaxID=104663 RepID=A0A1G7QR08_CHIFI|nr:type IX secretion system membrane protein PorP/SprF [Chitinophaga filiformis]SDG00309.1 type IX secretion system membrane protein, PorP/SprF family [Chitinophaga filiformis]
MNAGVKYCLCAILMLISFRIHAQQDVQFSQYAFNGLSVNPAYAGYKDALYINCIYRQQWTGLPGAPRTAGVSVDGPLRPMKSRAAIGLGLQLTADMLGPQKSYSVYGSYSYIISLDDDNTRRLSFGLGIGISQYQLDGNSLRYFDSEDAVFPAGSVNAFSPDARFGIFYHSPSFFISASVLDLFSNVITSDFKWKGYDYENIRKTRHLYLSAGCMVPISEQLKLKPSVMLKDDLNGPTAVDLTTMLLIDQVLWIGGSYRTAVPIWKKELPSRLEQRNAASAIIEYYISDRYRIGYAYDLNINQMADAQGGSHEISIGILFPSKKFSVYSPRYF